MLIQVGIFVRKQRTEFGKRLQMEILYPIMNEENLLHMRGMSKENVMLKYLNLSQIID